MPPLIVVPDSNVLIHGRSLHELPWEEFEADIIEVRVVGQVVGEIDTIKNRTGRPSRIARDISTQLRTLLAATDQTEVLREGGPRVTRRLWLGKREASTPRREGLDLTRGDQAIINQVLALADAGCEVVLLTDDVLAAALADDFGAPFKLLPETWRRPAEQDHTEKEIARLKTDNARLKAAEPRLRGWFESGEDERIERIEAMVYRYEALAPEFVEGLMVRIERAAPMSKLTPPAPEPSQQGLGDLAALHEEWSGRGHRPLTAHQIKTYEEAYTAWLGKIRSLLERLHVVRTHRRKWPDLVFVADNEGERPADQALVELEVSGDFFIERPERRSGVVADVEAAHMRSETHLDMPPDPPKPERRHSLLSALSLAGLNRPAPSFGPAIGLAKGRDADAFYWRTGREGPVGRMELECASWRHKRDPERFRFKVNGSDASPIRGAVIATLSAANVSEPVAITLPVRIAFEERSLEDDADKMVRSFERAMARDGVARTGASPS